MVGYKRFRRILFWTFVLLFFVTASSILFYAFGYRYSFDRGIFVYSGSITLQTVPDTVEVKIDGVIIPEKRIGFLNNSIHIPGLMPGEHFLEVSAPGYKTWAKRAIVSSGVSTEFWNVVLPSESPTLEPFPDTKGAIAVLPEPTGNRLAIVFRVNNETSIVVLDRSSGVRRQVFASTALSLSEEQGTLFSWSPSRNRLLLPLVDETGISHPTIVDIRTGESILIADTVEAKLVDTTRFDGTDSDTLLFLSEKILYRLALDGDRVTSPLAEAVEAYDISNGNIYLTKNSHTGIIRFRNTSREDSASSVVTVWPETTLTLPYSLVIYDEDRIALLERHGDERLFVYNNGEGSDVRFQKIADHVSDIAFSDDGKKLLFFSRNEINVYFFRAWEVQPVREENSVIQIARFSDSVDHVEWTEDYEHLLFNQNDTVKLVELDGRDRRIISDIVTLLHPPLDIVPLYRENRLFFVVPDSGVSSMIFPEPQTFFGQ